MFPFFRPKRADVISHWYSLIPGFSMPVKDFYEEIERELKAHEVPNLEINRVEFAEGGLLSSNRTYLRMQREMLVFDICAAPFGKDYFFSCRFAEIPTPITIWHLLALLILFFISFGVFLRLFSLMGFIYFPLAIIALIYLLRNAVSLGLKDLDGAFAKAPLIGPIYLRFFRRETYYRHDTRLMYCDSVNEIAKEAVQTITGSKGIEQIRFNEFSPLLEDLYRRRFVRLIELPKK